MSDERGYIISYWSHKLSPHLWAKRNLSDTPILLGIHLMKQIKEKIGREGGMFHSVRSIPNPPRWIYSLEEYECTATIGMRVGVGYESRQSR